MIRRAAILMLIAAFSLATTPSFACTGISLKAKDGAAIRSRTLEFGFSLQSNVLVVPAGKEFSGTLPGGGKGLTYKSRYGIVGANALGATATIDVERSGLVDRSVLFPGLRQYADASQADASRALTPRTSACRCLETSLRSMR